MYVNERRVSSLVAQAVITSVLVLSDLVTRKAQRQIGVLGLGSSA